MKFIQLKSSLKDFIVFTVNDIKKIKGNFDQRRLIEWQQKAYIRKIRRNYYMFSDVDLDERTLFIIANRIYSPSYVSLESAMSLHHLIPESVYGITSVSSRKTETFTTSVGDFIYRSIAPRLMFGYELFSHKNHTYKIADMEKTLLDFFYLNAHLSTKEDFIELRIHSEELLKKLDMKKLQSYLRSFHNRSLEKRISLFLKSTQNAVNSKY